MQMTTLGIDISKNVFQLHGVDAQGKVGLSKRVSRANLLSVMGRLAPVPRRTRSLRGSPLLGPVSFRAWS